MLFDSHCHLDFPVFDTDRNALLDDCYRHGIHEVCIPATEQQHWPRLLKLLGQHNSGVTIHGALGLHPYFIEHHQPEHMQTLRQLLLTRPEHVVAIGETGLDFYMANPNVQRQTEILEQHIQLAGEFELPLILHSRKSHDQLTALLRRHKFKQGGIVHAWSGSDQQAEALINLGFCLGLGGALTYNRAQRLRRQVQHFSPDHFVLETDAPDMRPAQAAEQRNTPLTLLPVLRIVSDLLNLPEPEVARQMTFNTRRVFRLTAVS